MTRKAIFGGTFDPIHNGHLNIAYEALYDLKLDEIIFVPSGNPPHKKSKNITDGLLRYEMVKMAIRSEKSFSISDYEIKKDDISFTYKTLKHFKDLEKDTQWYFITGADCLFYLESWKNVKEIFQLCTLVVFNRLGYEDKELNNRKREIEEKYKGKIIIINTPFLEISSTEIRNRVLEGKVISYLLPISVENTIKDLNLYKKGHNYVE